MIYKPAGAGEDVRRRLRIPIFAVRFWYMAILINDTHQAISLLQSKGYSKEQAEGFVELVKDLNTSEVVTKGHLDVTIAKLRADLYRYIFGIAVGQVALIVGLIQLLK